MKRKFNNVLDELKVLRRQLSEDYIFNGDDGMMDDGMDDGMNPEQQEVDPSMVQQAPQQMGQGDSEEEKAMRAQEIIKHEPIVAKIREISIEGLKKYADHPTSDLYSYFKSVFLDSDKLLTKTGGK